MLWLGLGLGLSLGLGLGSYWVGAPWSSGHEKSVIGETSLSDSWASVLVCLVVEPGPLELWLMSW